MGFSLNGAQKYKTHPQRREIDAEKKGAAHPVGQAML